MDYWEVVARRRMVRAFQANEPVDAAALDRILDGARRAPSAGNTDGTALVVLEGDATSRYWDVTLPAGARRDAFRWHGLLAAPVLVLPCASADAYVARYAEADKARTGLGVGAARWPVPYWTVDTAFAAMRLLDGAVAEGLGACFFGLFDHEAAVKGALGIPEGWQPVGTVAIGHPDAATDAAGRSAMRRRPELADVVHRGAW